MSCGRTPGVPGSLQHWASAHAWRWHWERRSVGCWPQRLKSAHGSPFLDQLRDVHETRGIRAGTQRHGADWTPGELVRRGRRQTRASVPRLGSNGPPAGIVRRASRRSDREAGQLASLGWGYVSRSRKGTFVTKAQGTTRIARDWRPPSGRATMLKSARACEFPRDIRADMRG